MKISVYSLNSFFIVAKADRKNPEEVESFEQTLQRISKESVKDLIKRLSVSCLISEKYQYLVPGSTWFHEKVLRTSGRKPNTVEQHHLADCCSRKREGLSALSHILSEAGFYREARAHQSLRADQEADENFGESTPKTGVLFVVDLEESTEPDTPYRLNRAYSLLEGKDKEKRSSSSSSSISKKALTFSDDEEATSSITGSLLSDTPIMSGAESDGGEPSGANKAGKGAKATEARTNPRPPPVIVRIEDYDHYTAADILAVNTGGLSGQIIPRATLAGLVTADLIRGHSRSNNLVASYDTVYTPHMQTTVALLGLQLAKLAACWSTVHQFSNGLPDAIPVTWFKTPKQDMLAIGFATDPVFFSGFAKVYLLGPNGNGTAVNRAAAFQAVSAKLPSLWGIFKPNGTNTEADEKRRTAHQILTNYNAERRTVAQDGLAAWPEISEPLRLTCDQVLAPAITAVFKILATYQPDPETVLAELAEMEGHSEQLALFIKLTHSSIINNDTRITASVTALKTILSNQLFVENARLVCVNYLEALLLEQSTKHGLINSMNDALAILRHAKWLVAKGKVAQECVEELTSIRTASATILASYKLTVNQVGMADFFMGSSMYQELDSQLNDLLEYKGFDASELIMKMVKLHNEYNLAHQKETVYKVPYTDKNNQDRIMELSDRAPMGDDVHWIVLLSENQGQNVPKMLKNFEGPLKDYLEMIIKKYDLKYKMPGNSAAIPIKELTIGRIVQAYPMISVMSIYHGLGNLIVEAADIGLPDDFPRVLLCGQMAALLPLSYMSKGNGVLALLFYIHCQITLQLTPHLTIIIDIIQSNEITGNVDVYYNKTQLRK